MLCPRCGNVVPADDVNLENLVAKCRPCNEVFSFTGGRTAAIGAKAFQTPRPGKVRVEEDGDPKRVSWSWFRPMILFLVFFCIAWDSFLVFWYSIALTLPGTPWLMIVFPIAHLAVGVGLTYYVIAALLNRTVVEVGTDRLTVRHGPVPWVGGQDLRTADVQQLYCTEESSWGRRGNIPLIHYHVNALMSADRKVKLLSVDDKEHALCCEQLLEAWLNIKPAPVRGEIAC